MEINKIEECFNVLGVPDVTRSKVLSTLAFYRDNGLMNPTHFFINQQKDAEKNIRYDKLWLFDGAYCAESDISNGKVAGDLCKIKDQVMRYEFSASNSNFEEGNNELYLNLDLMLGTHLNANFQAFGFNRKFLWDIFLNHIKINLVKN